MYIYNILWLQDFQIVTQQQLFSEKYKHLYNSIPYNIDDMHAIESRIIERLHNCENVKYVISHSDVINAVSH